MPHKLPKLPKTTPTSPQRRKALSCRGRKCPDCVVLDVRNHGDPEPAYLKICKPYLWMTDVSHLIMMLEMRVARIEDPDGGMSLSKMDEIIGKDIEDVLRHRVVPEEHFERFEEFVRRVEGARHRLGGVEGWSLGEKVGDVVRRMRRMLIA